MIEAPYIKPLTHPFRLVSLVKKLIVIGNIGNTQGVSNASNPPIKPNKNVQKRPSFCSSTPPQVDKGFLKVSFSEAIF